MGESFPRTTKYIDRWVRLYSIPSLIAMFAFNSIIYWVTMFLCRDWYHYDFTLAVDEMVPFVPEWVYVYLICYLFWAVNYILAAHFGRECYYRFVTADLLSRMICLLFFIILPTTNVRPQVEGDGLAVELMRWLYRVDMPVNLFPSIHCLVSWFSFIAVRGRKEIPLWYRRFSCIFALMVVASTQFTKQHYLVDAFGGILLAESAWWFGCHTNNYLYIKNFFENLNKILRRILLRQEKKCVK